MKRYDYDNDERWMRAHKTFNKFIKVNQSVKRAIAFRDSLKIKTGAKSCFYESGRLYRFLDVDNELKTIENKRCSPCVPIIRKWKYWLYNAYYFDKTKCYQSNFMLNK